MPEETGQLGGTLSYVASEVVTSSNVATVQGLSMMTSLTKGSVEFYQTLGMDGLFQSDSFDVGGAFSPDDQTEVVITKDGQATAYVNKVSTGETFAQVIANLLSRINLDEDIAAKAIVETDQATITVSSATGMNYTLAVISSGTMTTGAVASLQTGSGAAAVKMRKVVGVDVEYSISSDGSPQISDTYRFYDGAETPGLVQSLVLSAQRHPQKLSTIQTNNGS